MQRQYIIRPTKPEDCQTIQDLVHEFCASSGVPDKSSITEKGLKEDGFGGEQKFFHSLVAQTTNSKTTSTSSADEDAATDRIIGYAMYFYGYSTWHGKLVFLEDVYITPKHRGFGIGTTLMREVAKIAANVGCNRMQWLVLSGNHGARRLYNRIGAEDLTESESGYRVITLRKDKFTNFVDQSQCHGKDVDIRIL